VKVGLVDWLTTADRRPPTTDQTKQRTSNIEQRTSNIEHRTTNIEQRTTNNEQRTTIGLHSFSANDGRTAERTNDERTTNERRMTDGTGRDGERRTMSVGYVDVLYEDAVVIAVIVVVVVGLVRLVVWFVWLLWWPWRWRWWTLRGFPLRRCHLVKFCICSGGNDEDEDRDGCHTRHARAAKRMARRAESKMSTQCCQKERVT